MSENKLFVIGFVIGFVIVKNTCIILVPIIVIVFTFPFFSAPLPNL